MFFCENKVRLAGKKFYRTGFRKWDLRQIMRMISPDKIATEILRIMESAEKYLILVSPYNDWRNWQEFQRNLKLCLGKKITVCLYVRENDFEVNKYNYWYELGLRIFTIENLHAKLYLNEKEFIQTSLNLLYYSVRFSLEIASITVTNEEYKFYKEYFDQHIKYKGSEFVGWSKPENENEYNIIWFSRLKTVDMYFW